MKSTNKEYGFSNKWSSETEASGFTQVPNILLTCQGQLGLTHAELVTLIQLISFWYEHGNKVYPSIARVAKRSHKGYSTTQRHLKSLEEKGFLKRRHVFGKSNVYDLKPCAVKLHGHQSTCELCIRSAHKRGLQILKVSRVPSSEMSKKEYLPKRQTNNTNEKFSGTSRLSDLLASHRYGGTS